jgi:hypothetical protein
MCCSRAAESWLAYSKHRSRNTAKRRSAALSDVGNNATARKANSQGREVFM